MARRTVVVPFGDDRGSTVLVIADGRGYVVDARAGALLLRTRSFYSPTVIVPPQPDFVMVADESRA